MKHIDVLRNNINQLFENNDINEYYKIRKQLILYAKQKWNEKINS